MDSAADAVVEVIDEFVRVETMVADNVVHQMTKDNAKSLDTVIATNLPIIYLVVYLKQTE